MSLQNKALLVQLNISQWQARKFDRKATQDVANLHGVLTAAGRYNKALLPATDLLSHVHAKSQLIRSAFYKNTLPWGIEGTQMLPSANYFSFLSDYRKHKAEWELLVSRFVAAYPSLIVDAQKALKSMFNASEYPDDNEIASKFKIDLAVFPVPSDDFRVELDENELEEIKEDVDRRVKEASIGATKELWNRLREKVQAVHTKLSDPSAIFRDSLFENLQETCTLVDRMNFANDEKLTERNKQINEHLAAVHPDTVRCDPDYRQQIANIAKEFITSM